MCGEYLCCFFLKKDELEQFKDKLLSFCETTEFATVYEKEKKNRKTPHLITTHQKTGNKTEAVVYRKDTYVPTIIHTAANQPVQYKSPAFRSFINRGYTHCSNENIFKEN